MQKCGRYDSCYNRHDCEEKALNKLLLWMPFWQRSSDHEASLDDGCESQRYDAGGSLRKQRALAKIRDASEFSGTQLVATHCLADVRRVGNRCECDVLDVVLPLKFRFHCLPVSPHVV